MIKVYKVFAKANYCNNSRFGTSSASYDFNSEYSVNYKFLSKNQLKFYLINY